VVIGLFPVLFELARAPFGSVLGQNAAARRVADLAAALVGKIAKIAQCLVGAGRYQNFPAGNQQ